MIRTLAAALATSTCLVALATPAAAQTREFNVPAGSLRTALDVFARQSGRQVIYRGDVRSARSPGVSGARTAEDALNAILAGSGFVVKTDRSGAFAIVKAGNASAAAASQPGAGEGPAGSGAADDSDAARGDIVVTGSRIRGADPLSPTRTITRTEIDNSGFGRLDQVFQSVPQTFKSAALEYNTGTAQGVDAQSNTTAGSGVDLRGLGQGGTLTLLNGHRLTTSSGNLTDISLIPLALVDHVDIVMDGASSVYGSDAIAGVVNISTRRNFSGAETSVRLSSVTSGDKFDYELSQLFGHNWKSGNVTIGLSHRHDSPLRAYDRDFATGAGNTILLPKSEQESGYVGFTQDLLSTIQFRSDTLASTRKFNLFNFRTNSAIDGRTTSISTFNNLSAQLPSSWKVSISGDYAHQKDDSHLLSTSSNLEYGAVTELSAAEIAADGPLFDLPGGKSKLALGARYQVERLEFTGANGSENFSRKDRAIFAELYLPVFGPDNAIPIIDKLVFNLSARYDHYSDAGETFNPKYAVEWRPISALSLKASYSTSFRAPSFQAMTTTDNLFAYLTTLPDAGTPSGSSLTLLSFGGNPNLKPEKSKSFVLGAEFRPTSRPSFSIVADFYDIRYRDRLQYLFIGAPFDSSVLATQYSDFVTRNPSASQINEVLNRPRTQFFADSPTASPLSATVLADLRWNNAAATQTQGIDLALSDTFDISDGKLAIIAQGTYITKFIQQITNSSPILDRLNQAYFPVDFNGNLTATWTSGPWTTLGRVNYTSNYRDKQNSVCAGLPNGCGVNSWTVVDLAITYESQAKSGPFAGFNLQLGVSNILDTDPPFVNDVYKTGYDGSHASPLGRVVQFQVRKRW